MFSDVWTFHVVGVVVSLAIPFALIPRNDGQLVWAAAGQQPYNIKATVVKKCRSIKAWRILG